MHELCGIRIGKYDIFHWKQAFFGEEIPKKLVKNIKICTSFEALSLLG
jgi:hypothetical protein